MNNRFKIAAVVGTFKLTQQIKTLGGALNAANLDIRSLARHTLMALGMTSIAALMLMFFKPELTDSLKELSPFSADYDDQIDAQSVAFASMLELPQQSDAAVNMADKPASPFAAKPVEMQFSAVTVAPVEYTKEQQRVTSWLARRYHVAGSATRMLVEASYASAHEVRIDPLLILAVMAIESRLNPFAESAVGAQGLMQVMAKVHYDKFHDHGGVKAVLNPIANIKVGALILKDYVRRGGSVEAGLKLYVGAGNMDGDGGYGGKVLAEYQRLQAVSLGKRVPTFTSPLASPATDTMHEARVEPKATGKEALPEPA